MEGETETRSYPGARPPDRTHRIDSSGLGLAVNEWGDPDAPLIGMVHGGFDFSRTFDVFAPMLADGGWRVAAWDARGHGDSDRAHLYSWASDVRRPPRRRHRPERRAHRPARALEGRRPAARPARRPPGRSPGRASTSTGIAVALLRPRHQRPRAPAHAARRPHLVARPPPRRQSCSAAPTPSRGWPVAGPR